MIILKTASTKLELVPAALSFINYTIRVHQAYWLVSNSDFTDQGAGIQLIIILLF